MFRSHNRAVCSCVFISHEKNKQKNVKKERGERENDGKIARSKFWFSRAESKVNFCVFILQLATTKTKNNNNYNKPTNTIKNDTDTSSNAVNAFFSIYVSLFPTTIWVWNKANRTTRKKLKQQFFKSDKKREQKQ